MKRNVTRTEPAAAEVARRITTFTCRRRDYETLINSLSSTAPVQSHGLIYSRSPSSCFITLREAVRQSSITDPQSAIPCPCPNSHSCLFASVRKPTARLRQPRQGHARLQRKNLRKPCLQGFLPLPDGHASTFRARCAFLRIFARNSALLLILACYGGIALGIALSRKLTRWNSPRTLTQADPGLAQIFLSYGANFLSLSDPIRPNLSQRLFRRSFRANLTYGQVCVHPILAPNQKSTTPC
jgi:hypothetical protein